MERKRLFDINEALDTAMREFWQYGYDGTSISRLCETIGIGKTSLYSVFNCKEELFERALTRYEQQYLRFMWEAVAAPTAYDVARLLIYGLIHTITLPDMPQGAFGVITGVACAPECETIRQTLIEWRVSHEQMLIERFRRAKRDGDLEKGVRPEALAGFLLATNAGLAMQAKAGLPRAALDDIARVTLKIFPSASRLVRAPDS